MTVANTVRAFYKNGEEPTLIDTPADIDALVDAVLAEMFENSVITLYSTARPLMDSGVPDHEMRVAILAEAKVGGIRYAGDDGTNEGSWYVPGQVSQRKSSTSTKDTTKDGHRTRRSASRKCGKPCVSSSTATGHGPAHSNGENGQQSAAD